MGDVTETSIFCIRSICCHWCKQFIMQKTAAMIFFLTDCLVGDKKIYNSKIITKMTVILIIVFSQHVQLNSGDIFDTKVPQRHKETPL